MAVSDTGQQPSSALTALPSSAFHPLTSAGPSLPSEGGGGHPPTLPVLPSLNPTCQSCTLLQENHRAVFLDIQFNISNTPHIGAAYF